MPAPTHRTISCPRLPRLFAALRVAAIAGTCTIAQSSLGAAPEPRRVAIVPQLDTPVLRLNVGKPRAVSARAELEDGRLLALESNVTWNSTNPAVVRLTRASDASGTILLTPLQPGTASVSITYPPISGATRPISGQRTTGDAITVIVEAP